MLLPGFGRGQITLGGGLLHSQYGSGIMWVPASSPPPPLFRFCFTSYGNGLAKMEADLWRDSGHQHMIRLRPVEMLVEQGHLHHPHSGDTTSSVRDIPDPTTSLRLSRRLSTAVSQCSEFLGDPSLARNLSIVCAKVLMESIKNVDLDQTCMFIR